MARTRTPAAATSTALVPVEDVGLVQLVLDLEKGGALTKVSLDLTDTKMPIDRWLALGRFLGDIDGSTRWWIGDWLIFGEGIYGEESAQGVDDIHGRYDEAQRITGLDHGTLMNIRSICARIPRERRRPEVKFWIHAEVAALEPNEQKAWLTKAIKNGWNRAQLREAIREAKGGDPADPNPGNGGGASRLSQSEQLHAAAHLVWVQAQKATDGSFVVPPEPMAQLAAALGEGE